MPADGGGGSVLVSDVAIVVPAAGASRRMGRNKLLLDVGGEAMVARAVRTALDARLGPVVVVTGHDRQAVESALRGVPCRWVHNSNHAHGMHTSVAAGATCFGDEHRAAIVALADMPFVTSDMLRALADRHRRTGAPVVASCYGGGPPAPPVLYDRGLFGELRRLDARGGRAVIQRHADEVETLSWPLAASRDLDCPADYEHAQAVLARPGPAFASPVVGPPRAAGNHQAVAGSLICKRSGRFLSPSYETKDMP